jgi:hypothetical protein
MARPIAAMDVLRTSAVRFEEEFIILLPLAVSIKTLRFTDPYDQVRSKKSGIQSTRIVDFC